MEWSDAFLYKSKWLKTSVEQRLKDQYIQKWQSDITESSKGQIYTIFKTEFGPQKYLNLLPKNLEQHLLNLEQQITISQTKLGDGVAPQSLKELAMSAIGVKQAMNIIIFLSVMFLNCSGRNIFRKNITVDQTFINFPN